MSCEDLVNELHEITGCPSRIVLEQTERDGPGKFWKDGHLSKSSGFLPKNMSHLGNLEHMPDYSLWWSLAKSIPGLLSRNGFREAARRLPLYSADENALPDNCLHEAMCVLGIMTYSFRYEQRLIDDPETIEDIPDAILKPWTEVSQRLGRKDVYCGYEEYVTLNAFWKDVNRPEGDRWSLDNIEMAYPVFGTKTERVFLMVQNDMQEKFIPAVEAMVKAQESVILEDNQTLIKTLLVIKNALERQIQVFHKICVNKTVSSMYCDPVEWAKTTAQHTTAWKTGVPGLGGNNSPMFHALDCFFGRIDYACDLGKETLQIREHAPLAHRKFFDALCTVSVGRYCYESKNDPQLRGIYDGLLDSYAGERGFLGTHRYKVYGFLELAFKTGRNETNGHTMTSDDRGWEVTHDILAVARNERLKRWKEFDTFDAKDQVIRGTFRECPLNAKVKERSSISSSEIQECRKVTIDLENTGITYLPGDRLAILPENTPTDVHKVLDVLGLSPNTSIEVTGEWKEFFHPRSIIDAIELVKAARLRPLPRSTLETILQLSDQCCWQLKPALLEELEKSTGSENGTDMTLDQLVHAVDSCGDSFSTSLLCDVFQIEFPRTYSVSSAQQSINEPPKSVDLTVSRHNRILSTGESVIGTASGFLNPPIDQSIFENGTTVRVGISKPLFFRLPEYPTNPIVMFATGSGIGPFRAFLQERIKRPLRTQNYLFLGLRDSQSILYETELAALVKSGDLILQIAFSREDVGIDGIDDSVSDVPKFKLVKKKRCRINELVQEKNIANMLWKLLLPTNVKSADANVYVCGSAMLLRGIFNAIEDITISNGRSKYDLLKLMFANNRFQYEVFRTQNELPNPKLFTYSEISKHNSAEHGHWIAIENKVYVVTKFMQIHPGGAAIIQANSGLDATHVFKQVAHNTNAEIVSLIDHFKIGIIPTIEFKSAEVEQVYDSLLNFLHRIVEMENIFQFDAASLDNIATENDDSLNDTRHFRHLFDLHRRVLLIIAPAICGAELQFQIAEFNQQLMDKSQYDVPKESYDTLLKSFHGKCALHSVQVLKYFCRLKEHKNKIHHRTSLAKYINELLEEDQTFIQEVKNSVANALHELEKNPTNMSLQMSIVEILKHLGSVIHSLEKYLCRIKDTLYSRYVVKGERSAKLLWHQVKIRMKENCLALLSQDPTMQENNSIHKENTSENHAHCLESCAVEIISSLATTWMKATFGKTRDKRRKLSGGLSRASLRRSYDNSDAQMKQLARITTTIKGLDPSTITSSSNLKKILVIEFLRGFFLTNIITNRHDLKHYDKRIQETNSTEFLTDEENDNKNSSTPLSQHDSNKGFTIYTQPRCGYSMAAVNLLKGENIEFDKIDISINPELKQRLIKASQSRQFPQIYFGMQFIGGIAELRAIYSAGMLHEMKEIKQCNTSTDINLTQDDIEVAMKQSDIPIEAKEALHLFSAVFESTPSANIISFNVLCCEYLQNENQVVKNNRPKYNRATSFQKKILRFESLGE